MIKTIDEQFDFNDNYNELKGEFRWLFDIFMEDLIFSLSIICVFMIMSKIRC